MSSRKRFRLAAPSSFSPSLLPPQKRALGPLPLLLVRSSLQEALLAWREVRGFAALRGWSGDVVALTDGRYDVPTAVRQRLESAAVPIDERRISRLSSKDGRLEHVEFVEGAPLRRDVLFAHPPQRQVDVVRSLPLPSIRRGWPGSTRCLARRRRRGIYGAGDLVTSAQGAILAAASGILAAARLNHALTADLATSGSLPSRSHLIKPE